MTAVPNESWRSLLNERYSIQQLVSKRAGRQTLLVRDLQIQELAVIKLLPLGKDFQWQDLKLFEREAKTLQMLSHPAIPRYLDYFEIDQPNFKGFALVQSYVAGKSLDAHLKTGRTFTEVEVKEIAKILLNILTYLHQQSPPIIHRDIKPSNVILGDRLDDLHLVDFGSVQHLATKEGSTVTVVGTYGYMPLEQFGGQVTAASDLYSLAATLIYLATGRHPADLSDQNSRIQFRSIAHLSSDFADWLEWLTQPAIDRRPTSAQLALQVLEDPNSIKQSTSSTKHPQAIKRPRNSGNITLIKTERCLRVVQSLQGVLNLILIVFLAACTAHGYGYVYDWWEKSLSSTPLHGGQIINGGVIDIDFAVMIGLEILVGGFFVALFFLAILRRCAYQIRLRVDRHSIQFTRTLFGLKLHQRRYPIAHTPFSIASTQPTLEPLDNGDRWLSKKLGDGSVTDAEAEWLAYEVANWLKTQHWV